MCTLILITGRDLAKSLAASGLGVNGRDLYDVYPNPIPCKLLNVREAWHNQILESAEINNLIKKIMYRIFKQIFRLYPFN